MTPYVTTLELDRRDTDAAITLTPEESREHLRDWWLAASYPERRRWLANATADDLDTLNVALDAAAGWAAINATVAAGLEMAAGHRAAKHLSNVA